MEIFLLFSATPWKKLLRFFPVSRLIHAIMRTFVQLRRLMDTNSDLARKIEKLENKYDEKFSVVFAAIKQLITPPDPAKKRIGFHPNT